MGFCSRSSQQYTDKQSTLDSHLFKFGPILYVADIRSTDKKIFQAKYQVNSSDIVCKGGKKNNNANNKQRVSLLIS